MITLPRCSLLNAAIVTGILAGSVTPAIGATLFTLSSDNTLQSFDSGSPSSPTSTQIVSGVGVGEFLVGMDFRPANGQLLALSVDAGNTGRLYNINMGTGLATLVAPVSVPLVGSTFGVDFNPTVDRIRITSDQGQNLRVNPDTGATIVDGALTYAEGDVAFGTSPTITASAYTNSFPEASSTTLFNIDTIRDFLVIQNPANAGTLMSVGPLGVNATDLNGFDIAFETTNIAFAALTADGLTSLYTIDLATGAASIVGVLGAGTPVIGLSAVPPPRIQPGSFIRSQQHLRVVSEGGGWQHLFFNYSTGELTVTPFRNMDGASVYTLPRGQFVGIFLYDYNSARFSQAVYSLKENL